MVATNFSDGSYLTPTIMNTVYSGTVGSGKGHAHDGVDADGHAQKIQLNDAEMISGVIPLTNMSKVPLTSAGVTGYLPISSITGGSYVDTSSAQAITGVKGFGSDTYFKSIELHGASSDYIYAFDPSTVSSMPPNSYARVWKVITGSGLNEYHVGGYIYSAKSISDTYVIPLTSFGCSAYAAAYHVDIGYINSAGNGYGWIKGTCPNTSFTSFGGNNSNGHGSVASAHAALGYSSSVKLWFHYTNNDYVFRFQGVIREITASWD